VPLRSSVCLHVLRVRVPDVALEHAMSNQHSILVAQLFDGVVELLQQRTAAASVSALHRRACCVAPARVCALNALTVRFWGLCLAYTCATSCTSFWFLTQELEE
jgi:hypothetical protein